VAFRRFRTRLRSSANDACPPECLAFRGERIQPVPSGGLTPRSATSGRTVVEELEISTACGEHAAVGVVKAQKSPPFFDGRIGSLENHLWSEAEYLGTVGCFTALVGVSKRLRPAVLVGGNQGITIRIGVNRPEEV